MKRIILSILSLTTLTLQPLYATETLTRSEQLDLKGNLVLKEELMHIQSHIKTILDKLEIPYENTMEGIHEASQKNLLRASGKERWESNNPGIEKIRPLILDLANQLHMLEEVTPPLTNEKCQMILFGATVHFMRYIIHYLEKLLKAGHQIDKIFFLTGDRPLEAFEKSSLTDTNKVNLSLNEYLNKTNSEEKTDDSLPKTETEAAKYLWEQNFKDSDLYNKVIFVDSKGAHDSKTGAFKRATTMDTIKDLFLNNNYTPNQKTILISRSPFIQYQESVFFYASLMAPKDKKPILFYGCGPKSKETSFYPAQIFTDTLARYEYNIYKAYNLLNGQ